MPTINKLTESTKITYTTSAAVGDVTIVLQKHANGDLEYSIKYVNGDHPTWEQFTGQLESGFTVVNL